VCVSEKDRQRERKRERERVLRARAEVPAFGLMANESVGTWYKFIFYYQQTHTHTFI